MPIDPKSLPTREQLLSYCRRGSVPQDKWSDRDSAGAQSQLGEAYALLNAGCEFAFDNLEYDCWWITVWYRGFDWYEGGLDPDENRDKYMSSNTFYIPTNERLNATKGGDWY